MKLVLSLMFLLFNASTIATEFRLSNFDRYGDSLNIELSLFPDNAFKLAEVFKTLKFSRDVISVRLIGTSSNKTNSELLKYYEFNMPNELKVALNSSGNTHNPKISPLRNSFNYALESTSLYKELINQMKARGYIINKIEFEKFIVNNNSSISIPDVYLSFVKMPNKLFKQDK